MLRRTIRQEGAKALLSGIGPRVIWISAGGAVFLGALRVGERVSVSAKGVGEASERLIWDTPQI